MDINLLDNNWTIYAVINPYISDYPPVVRLEKVMYKVILSSDRVWAENNISGEVFLIKNRTGETGKISDEDIKEFRWIKLRAVDIGQHNVTNNRKILKKIFKG